MYKKSWRIALALIPPESSSTKAEPQGEQNYIAPNIYILGIFTFSKGYQSFKNKLPTLGMQ